MNQAPVIYIITKLELGGAQKVCLSLFHQLQEKNTRTFLITGSEGILAQSLKNNPQVFFLESFKREIGIKIILLELKSFYQMFKIMRTLKKQNPHILVHTHSTKAGLMGRWAAFFAGIKNRIHTIHGHAFNDHHPWYAWWPIYLLELTTSLITTHFICVSTADSTIGKKLFPFFARKYSLIRAAVDFPLYIPAHKDTQVQHTIFIFGTLACFKPQKNLFDLLRAFEKAYQHIPQLRLEILGDGILRTQIEQWIIEHQLTHVITLHGWQKNVIPFMQKWHSFALTSLWEGLPCSVVEARMLKLPVICYDTGGISDIIFHKKNGLLYPQKDWQNFAQGMIECAQNRHLYESLKNYDDKLIDFYQMTMVQQHYDLYQKLS
ncbi:MAG: glycosyltransferase [Candidatus Babeliaceae bacterium]